ncbi:hypothetical protein KW796_00600 [Candidatus Parcubacteria bacterium]|nr:hypothetical protein [Candidatus Parcubacteria bacterium]
MTNSYIVWYYVEVVLWQSNGRDATSHEVSQRWEEDQMEKEMMGLGDRILAGAQNIDMMKATVDKLASLMCGRAGPEALKFVREHDGCLTVFSNKTEEHTPDVLEWRVYISESMGNKDMGAKKLCAFCWLGNKMLYRWGGSFSVEDMQTVYEYRNELAEGMLRKMPGLTNVLPYLKAAEM